MENHFTASSKACLLLFLLTLTPIFYNHIHALTGDTSDTSAFDDLDTSTPQIEIDITAALNTTTNATIAAQISAMQTILKNLIAPPTPAIYSVPLATSSITALINAIPAIYTSAAGTSTLGDPNSFAKATITTVSNLNKLLTDTKTVSNTTSIVPSGSIQTTTTAALQSMINTTTTIITKSTFTTALSAASAPTSGTIPNAITNVINGSCAATATTYASVASSYLVDFPNTPATFNGISITNFSVYTAIKTFFNTDNTLKSTVTGTTLTDLQTLLKNTTNLNKFLTSAEQTTAATWLTNVNSAVTAATAITNNQSAFSTALTAATTPRAINTIVNTAAYNSVTYLVDYPSTTNSIFTKIQSFFTSNVPNVTGQTLLDLQTLLNNSTNLNKFLTSAEQTTVTGTLLPAVTAAVAKVNNQTAFSTALTAATTPSTINTIVNTAAYNAVTYLVDYPSAATGIFSKIQTFFNSDNSINATVTGTTLTDLQTLLKNTTNLNKFLTSAEQTTAATWLTNVNSAVTAATAITNNQSAFSSALSSATTPSAINTIVNTAAYNAVTYLVDYPTAATGIFSKIQTFFNSDNSINTTVTGTTLTDLQTLLKNTTNLNKFLTSAEQTTAATWLTNVNFAVTAATAITNNKSAFSSALSSATTPSAINTIVNTAAYNSVSYLVDYPTSTGSTMFSIIQTTFFNTDNSLKSTVTGTTLTDLQTLLNNLTTIVIPSTTTNPFLSTSELTTAKTWLTNVNAAVTAATAITNNKSAFSSALSSATTPSAINTIVNTAAYNSVSYLVDYPTSTGSTMFSIIQTTFFNTDNSLKSTVTGTTLTDLQTLLKNLTTIVIPSTTTNPFLSTSELTTAKTWLTNVNAAVTAVTAITNNKSAFSSALSSATTPSAINTIVNTAAYNSVTYLVDYPTSTGSTMFSIIKGFFDTNNNPTVTGTTLTDLQTLLNKLTTIVIPSTTTNPFLSTSELATAKTWLTNVNAAVTAATAITNNKSAFSSALSSATTPSAINTIVNTAAYNSVSYLVDYPTSTGSTMFSIIQTTFFNTDNSLKSTVTGTTLTDLQTLLNNLTTIVIPSTTTNPFLSTSELTTAKTWLTNVNAAVTAATAITNNKSAFSSALSSATTPSAINTIVNTAAYNSVSYLVDYPTSTGSTMFSIIQTTFFNTDNSLKSTVTGTTLTDLQTLLKNLTTIVIPSTTTNPFLSTSELTTAKTWLTNVNAAVTAATAITNNKSAFSSALSSATTPSAINTIVNTAAYNSVSYLVDYPTSTGSTMFSIIQTTFFNTDNSLKSTVTGTTLTDLQTLLNNLTTIVIPSTTTNPFLSTSELATAKTWLTNINAAVTAATAISNALTSIGTSYTTANLTTLTGIVSNSTYNNASFQSFGIYTAIKGFFDSRTSANISSIQALLSAAAGKSFLTGIATTGSQTLQQLSVSEMLNIANLEAGLVNDVNTLINTPSITTINTLVNPNGTDITYVRNLRAAKAALVE